MFTIKKNSAFLLITLICLYSSFCFYNLNWGAPFYFHPDERNIASSVSQLKFPLHLNPDFFAYGSLPIYTIYFTGVLQNALLHTTQPITEVSFSQAIVISRFFSALFSISLIPCAFLIGKKLKDERTGLIAATLSTTSVGFIQFAHFGTFEMWLTFFTVILFWICLKIIHEKKILYIIIAGIILGILISTKISHLALLPLPILALLFKNLKLSPPVIPAHPPVIPAKAGIQLQISKTSPRHNLPNVLNFLMQTILLLITSALVFFLTNPYVLLDYHSFKNSMDYESSVALGTLPVFYTGEFKDSIPAVFQFLHVYPFILNPILTILFIPSFIYFSLIAMKHKNTPCLLLAACCLLLFLPQAFLYVKWTRYMIPTLPFIYLILAIALSDLSRLKFLSRYLVFCLLIGTSLLFSISYFITAFVQEDTRIAAEKFAIKSIPSTSPILSEVYDLGITPFNTTFPNIKLFNFYDLDNNSPESDTAALNQQLATSEYIILPSQRILKTRIEKPKEYPIASTFYSSLLAQTNGFQKIYETPCNIFCKIVYLNNPIYTFEETANVFDRPTIMIFKKM
jgi:hypothetical protein